MPGKWNRENAAVSTKLERIEIMDRERDGKIQQLLSPYYPTPHTLDPGGGVGAYDGAAGEALVGWAGRAGVGLVRASGLASVWLWGLGRSGGPGFDPACPMSRDY